MLQANLGLLKVLVAKSQAEGLQMHLRSMVESLLKWQDNTKNHFKAKVVVWLSYVVIFLKNSIINVISWVCCGWLVFQN